MKRKDFLRGIGLAGVSTFLPSPKSLAGPVTFNSALGGPVCTLIPSETQGPFPLDLTANTTFFRQDIRESKTGVQLNLKMKIFGVDNCAPMPNVRVNIWHCDKDGLYSGYSQQNNQGQAGLTYLRGYQIADANGEVNFVTIFPGWYTGRICHIHFQVYVSSVYAAVSQMTFPIDVKNSIYTNNSSLYTKGADPMTLASDNIFSDGYNFQLATLTPNSSGGYDAYLEVAVNGTGTLATHEPETGGQFKLGQNYPNPWEDTTVVPFNLINAADVLLEIWDLSGKKVAEISQKDLGTGDHTIEINRAALGLAKGSYAYQLQVHNSYGTYRQSKLMTAAH